MCRNLARRPFAPSTAATDSESVSSETGVFDDSGTIDGPLLALRDGAVLVVREVADYERARARAAAVKKGKIDTFEKENEIKKMTTNAPRTQHQPGSRKTTTTSKKASGVGFTSRALGKERPVTIDISGELVDSREAK